MPRYKEKRKMVDEIDRKLLLLSNKITTPELEIIRETLNEKINKILELPKWWTALLLPQKEQEQNTMFVQLNEFKPIQPPYIKVIVKWSNKQHGYNTSCCSIRKHLPIKKKLLTACLPVTQPDGSEWDFEKHDEFIPKWIACGGHCGCCGFFDLIELLHWKQYNK